MSNIPAEYWQDAGASGFVPKAKLSTELIEAVKVISEGGKYFSSEGTAGNTLSVSLPSVYSRRTIRFRVSALALPSLVSQSSLRLSCEANRIPSD